MIISPHLPYVYQSMDYTRALHDALKRNGFEAGEIALATVCRCYISTNVKIVRIYGMGFKKRANVII